MTKHKVGNKEKCPHCNTIVQFISNDSNWAAMRADTPSENIKILSSQCPSCTRSIISLEVLEEGYWVEYLVWPRSTGRPPVPAEVPQHITQDYNEAALVLQSSPKASAALSRRCLQSVLREVGNTKSRDLEKQIDEVASVLPGYIADQLHAVRQIGNFAAHPQKSQITGEILDVEPGEAEWNLEVLDELFDHYYVKPARQQQRKNNFNQKLQEAGKPAVK
jgi:hypothetical protein